MALLYLLSVFNSYFKHVLAVSPFAGNPQAVTFCLLCEKNRHPVSAYRTGHLCEFGSVYFQIYHPLNKPGQIPAVFQCFD